ncbi:MAG: hypothetical protein HOY78_02170 [Saccharothrix sp.]|nr:hypothetical protein [Saccharothrix sp.]
MEDPDYERTLDAVTGLVAGLGRLLGGRVRVTPAGGGEPLYGTLSGFELSQAGGPGAVFVTLREYPGSLAVDRVEPVEIDRGEREGRALPPTGRERE